MRTSLSTPLLLSDTAIEKFCEDMGWDSEELRRVLVEQRGLREAIKINISQLSYLKRLVVHDDHILKIMLWLLLKNETNIRPDEVEIELESDEAALLPGEYSNEEKPSIQTRFWSAASSTLISNRRLYKSIMSIKEFLLGYEYMYTKVYTAIFGSLILQQLGYYAIDPEYRVRTSLYSILGQRLFKARSVCGTVASQSVVYCSLANEIVLPIVIGAPIVWGLGKSILGWRFVKQSTGEQLNN